MAKENAPGSNTTSALGGGYFKYGAAVKFAFDDINDEEFGTAKDLKGYLPLITAPTTMQKRHEYVKSNPKEIEDLLWEMVRKYRDLFTDEDDEGVYKQLDHTLRCLFVIFPNLDHNIPRRNWLLEFVTMMNPVDSWMDPLLGTDSFAAGDGDSDFNYVEAVEKFRGGLPHYEMDFPSGLVALERLKGFYKVLFWDTLLPIVPDFNKQAEQFLMPDVCMIFQSHFILHGMEKDKDGPKYSNHTMLSQMWGRMGGWSMLIYFQLILEDVKLSDVVAKSKLMEISLCRASDIMILLNAVFGLHRDVSKKQLDSPITYAVKHEKAPLQQEWEATIKRIHDCYHDLRLTSDKMLKVFKSEEEAIRKYIRVVHDYVDGCLYFYTIMDRYEKVDQTEVVEL